MERAPNFGLEDERQIFGFVATLLVYGTDVDGNPRDPRCSWLLPDESIDSDVKGRALLELRAHQGARGVTICG